MLLTVTTQQNGHGYVTLGLFPDGTPSSTISGIEAAELKGLGPQGYVLHIDSGGVSAAATGAEGLFYASRTIAQIATDRTLLPGFISATGHRFATAARNTTSAGVRCRRSTTLKRLTRILGEAKGNMLELYH